MNVPTIGWLCDVLQARHSGIARDLPLGNISIDTRTLQPGSTFWALKASRDGHNFIADAFRKGAIAAVVSAQWKNSEAAASLQGRLIGVHDTQESLTMAASRWREALSFPIIGITGSNGKTSTKEIITAVLATRYSVQATQGNLNNHIGVPITILSLPLDRNVAVVEMGASFDGEIETLCEICRPTHGLVTSISGAHLEGFGSLDAVARTKGQLYDFIAESGTAFVPTDDPLCVAESENCQRRIGYGFSSRPSEWDGGYVCGSDFTLDSAACGTYTIDGHQIRIGIPGRAAALASLAAIAVGRTFEVPIERCAATIRDWRAVPGRFHIQKTGQITIIDDSYNANSASMQAALETLSYMRAERRVAILGDMNELGASARQAHEELGNLSFIECVGLAVFVGKQVKWTFDAAARRGIPCKWFETYESLEPDLADLIKPGDVVLVKASRSAKLERVVQRLKEVFG